MSYKERINWQKVATILVPLILCASTVYCIIAGICMKASDSPPCHTMVHPWLLTGLFLGAFSITGLHFMDQGLPTKKVAYEEEKVKVPRATIR